MCSKKKYQKETGGIVVRDGRKYPSKGMKVKGLYDYQTDEDDGLSFKEGQVITIIEADGDWWIGTLSGKQGEFPHNYVEIIESSAAAAAPSHASPAPTATHAAPSAHAEEPKKETGSWLSRLKSKKDSEKGGPAPSGPGPKGKGGGDNKAGEQVVKCQALFDFSAPKDDEDEGEYISFKKGDIIKTTPSSEDWWWGEINGQCGFFPFSYCQLVEGH